MRSIDKIIVHCTATPEGKPFTVQQIREWHTAPKPRGNGWRDIGYHYVVYLDGSVHNGRPVEQIGAHCSGHNAHSIGVCYVGGCDAVKRLPDGQLAPKDPRTPIQKPAPPSTQPPNIQIYKYEYRQSLRLYVSGHRAKLCARRCKLSSKPLAI